MAKLKIPVRLIVDADSTAEAEAVAAAITKIYRAAANEELIKLANAVEKKPGLIKTALKYI